MTLTVPFLAVLCLIANTYGKTFSDCELVGQLRQQGFPEHQLNDWVCLIKAESSSRTHVVGGPNSDGSHDYGLFQINDRYWCNPGDHPGKACNLRCQDLLSDDISNASQCTKKIFAAHGFSAWVGWVNECQWNLPHINC